MDGAILPKLLLAENKKITQFVNGFIWGRYRSRGWEWVDHIEKSAWSIEQKTQFLINLPFEIQTWKRSEQLLGRNEAEYWSKSGVNPFQAEDGLNLAIDKLVSYGRPYAAIGCFANLLNEKQPIDNPRAIRTLLAAVSSTEPANSLDIYETTELIKALQESPDTNPDDLAQVEWAYLALLDRPGVGASPKSLEQRLASDPNFFCEVIQLVYRSKNEEKSSQESTEQQKNAASNAFRLLQHWRIPPGVQSDGIFIEKHFNQWLKSVKKAWIESGHLEVALIHVGNALIHCPPDPDGLWIHHTAAEALTQKTLKKCEMAFVLEF